MQDRRITQLAIDKSVTLIAWAASDTIRRAIETEDGRIRDEAILRFQGGAAEYPYPPEVRCGKWPTMVPSTRWEAFVRPTHRVVRAQA